MKKTLILPVCIALAMTAGAAAPPQGAVVFRFDDNHSLAEWRELQQVFAKHHAPLNLAINSSPLVCRKAEFASFLQQIVKEGGEIMDHTPSHSCMKIVFPDAESAQRWKNHPGTDHIETNTVFLKTLIRKDISYKPQVKISIRAGKIIPVDEAAKRMLFHGAFLEFPDGKVYGCQKSGKDFSLCSIYQTPCETPERENLSAILTNQWRLQATDDALRLTAKISAEQFARLGLPAPASFISPGGWAVFPEDQQLARIYGKEFGYTMGDAYNFWGGVYGRNDGATARFAMYPCWDSLERKTIEESKRMIADMLAQHRVVSFISHFWHHKVPGGKAELLRRNDELLSWLRKKKIPILTMTQASRLLFDTPFPAGMNLMPELFTDLNEDGIPDGYQPGKDTVAERGTLKRNGSGNLFRIRYLTGLPAGKYTLRAKVCAPAGSSLKFSLVLRGRRKTENLPPVTVKTVKPEEILAFSFDVPDWLYALQIDCDAVSSGEVRFSAPTLIQTIKPQTLGRK